MKFDDCLNSFALDDVIAAVAKLLRPQDLARYAPLGTGRVYSTRRLHSALGHLSPEDHHARQHETVEHQERASRQKVTLNLMFGTTATLTLGLNTGLKMN